MNNKPLADKMQARMEKAKEMSDKDKLYRFKGILYPTLMCPEEHLKCLDDIKVREDDIMLVAYPKCGSGVKLLFWSIKPILQGPVVNLLYRFNGRLPVRGKILHNLQVVQNRWFHLPAL
ncbi:hypothetical protein XENOCAPTIV_012129 [Xenoophorus captivus]|uniref:Uncharacterized protein n=1 Tax=Xenoophorus captivus TaxID=1517983 RepID=A0ABV0R8E7_9TELE